MKLSRNHIKVAGLITVTCMHHVAFAAVTVDGVRDGGEGYAELAVQQTVSNWNDAGEFGGENEALANIHAVQDGENLAVHLAARVKNRGVILFVDSKPGGRTFIPSNLITSGGEQEYINNLGLDADNGMTFENGFEPDYAVRVFGNGGTGAFVNIYDLNAGTRVYAGNAGDSVISSGIISSMAASGLGSGVLDTLNYGASAQGVEMKLGLVQMGVPIGSQTVKFMAILMNADSTYASNQVLASRTSTTADIGSGRNTINFEAENGVQTLSVSVFNSGLLPGEDEDNDGYTNGAEQDGTALGYVSDPLIPNYTDMNVAASFNDWSTSVGGMTQGDTGSLTAQYHWTYDRHFTQPVQSIEYKFTTGNSFNTEWGQGAGTGAVIRNGSNISGFVGATGIYRFFFDQGALTQTFTRRTFEDLAGFLAAYAIDPLAPGYDGDSDDDGLQDGDEFTANTDPLNNDTDGDGINDDLDEEPLIQRRDITFSVDMSVQIAKGNFDPDGGYDVKLLVFTGASQNYLDPYTTGGFVMEDPDLDGIYTVTLTAVPGFETQSFGQYKFFHTTPNAPNSGYEEGFDRDFALGVPEVEQVLAPVFFSNDEGMPAGGYADWADANAGSGPFDGDFDQDGVKNGVEYFYGETGSSFTTNPAPVNGVISWPRGPNATGVTFKVWTSETLADPWVDVTGDADLSDPGFVKYTLPSGPSAPSKLFVRFEVLQDGPQ